MFSKLKGNSVATYMRWAVIIFLLYQVVRFLQLSLGMIRAKATSNVIKENTGITSSEVDFCAEVATKVYDAIWHYYAGTMEDEAAVIEQLSRLQTTAQARAVSMWYQQMANHSSLKDDLEKYVPGDMIATINANVRGALL